MLVYAYLVRLNPGLG